MVSVEGKGAINASDRCHKETNENDPLKPCRKSLEDVKIDKGDNIEINRKFRVFRQGYYNTSN